MTDIVERLREYTENIRGKDESPENYLAWQAAAEIERLRKAWDASIAERGELVVEIERMRNELHTHQLADGSFTAASRGPMHKASDHGIRGIDDKA